MMKIVAGHVCMSNDALNAMMLLGSYAIFHVYAKQDLFCTLQRVIGTWCTAL